MQKQLGECIDLKLSYSSSYIRHFLLKHHNRGQGKSVYEFFIMDMACFVCGLYFFFDPIIITALNPHCNLGLIEICLNNLPQGERKYYVQLTALNSNSLFRIANGLR